MSAGEGGWVRAASRRKLSAGEIIGVEVGGRSIAIYDSGGELFATDNVCTHAYACLSDGWLDARPSNARSTPRVSTSAPARCSTRLPPKT